MALVDSLLTAMVRANGDALVMHVGEKPIVVARSRSIDLSSRGLNLNAMAGMLAQLLPAEAQSALAEFGAVEHHLEPRGSDHFTVVAARGGDDIWIEIRRRREESPSGDRSAAPSAPRPEAVTIPIPAREPARGTAVDDSPAGTDREAAEVSAAVSEGMPDTGVAGSEHEHSPALAEFHPEPRRVPAVVEPRVPRTVRDVALELEFSPEAPRAPALSEGTVVDRGSLAVPVPPSVSGREPEAEGQPAMPAEAEPVLEEQPTGAVPAASDAASTAAALDASQAAEVEPRKDTPAHEGEPAATPPTDAPGREESRAEPDSPPEERPTEHAPDVVPAVKQEETAVIPDAELPRPMTEGHTASPSTPEAAMTDAASVGAVREVYGTRAAASMASPIATGRPSAGDSGGAAPPRAVPVPPDGEETPMTRTVRIEVPSRAAARAMSAERLLRLASDRGATELFLTTQARPHLRVGGEVRLLSDEPVLSASDLDAVLADITPEPSRDAVSRGERVEWLVELTDVGRVRCASFTDHRGPGAVFHLLATRAATAEELGLEAEARSLASEPDGLVIVAGPAGSDKSAILAAFVDEINRHRADYLITIEPCVYLVHENVQALVSQREVGADPARAAAATRAALNENPDVLVIDDLASGDVAVLAVQAASQGRLVLVSLEAGSTAEAVHRLIELVPAEKRSATRQALSRTFRGAIAQQLLRKTAGGRVAARELLMGTGAVARALADQTRTDVAAAIDAARGGAPLADAVASYVKSGVVDVREAFRKAPNRERLVTALRAAGVNTTAIDRLQ